MNVEKCIIEIEKELMSETGIQFRLGMESALGIVRRHTANVDFEHELLGADREIEKLKAEIAGYKLLEHLLIKEKST